MMSREQREFLGMAHERRWTAAIEMVERRWRLDVGNAADRAKLPGLLGWNNDMSARSLLLRMCMRVLDDRQKEARRLSDGIR